MQDTMSHAQAETWMAGHSFYDFWGTVVHFNHLRTEQLHGKAWCVLFNERLIYNLPAISATICLCCGLVCPQGAGGCGAKMRCWVSPCFTLWFQSTWLAQLVLITLSRLFLRQSNGSWEISIEQAFCSSLAHKYGGTHLFCLLQMRKLTFIRSMEATHLASGPTQKCGLPLPALSFSLGLTEEST